MEPKRGSQGLGKKRKVRARWSQAGRRSFWGQHPQAGGGSICQAEPKIAFLYGIGGHTRKAASGGHSRGRKRLAVSGRGKRESKTWQNE